MDVTLLNNISAERYQEAMPSIMSQEKLCSGLVFNYNLLILWRIRL
jgi:hypothetical protein